MKLATCLAWAAWAVCGFASQAIGAVPTFNGTCPGGFDVHADEGGPVYVDGRETALKRFNDNYYQAVDARSGVTLSVSRNADGSVQLSYTGADGRNGTCSVVSGGAPAAKAREVGRDGELPRSVTCESQGQAQTECDLDTRGEVQLVRQLSRTRCVQNQNWGLNRHSVWVKDGCRAEFRNTGDAHSAHAAGNNAPSLLGACNTRAGAAGALVTQVPVNDTVMELIIDYPDGRFMCMVSKEGQVQSLTALRKR